MHYRFAEFVLDTETEMVSGPDGPVQLRRRAFLLLRTLVEHAPALVGRDRILDEVWGHDALTPNVLPQAISEIRQALGDSAQSPRLIETRHRRGYRLLVPVQRADGTVPDARDVASAPARMAEMADPVPAPASETHRRASTHSGDRPRRTGRRLAIAAVLAAMALAIAVLLIFDGNSPDAPPTEARPALALMISADATVPDWLPDAGTGLLTVALAGDDRVQLLWGIGRSGRPEGSDVRWQTWMQEVLGADYALNGTWRIEQEHNVLGYTLLRLDDGRVVHSGEQRHADLAALCRAVALDLRRHLRLLDPGSGWLDDLPRGDDTRKAYYTGLADLANGRAGSAIAALEAAMADPAAGPRVRLALASAYRAGGRLNDARDQFGQTLGKSGGFAVGERLRLEAEAALVDYRYAAAAASLRALQSLMPHDGEVALALADAQIKARQARAAAATLASLEPLAAEASEDPRWHLARARLAQLEHQPGQARVAAEAARALADRFGLDELATQARLELAQLDRADGNLAQARDTLVALLDGPVPAGQRAEAQAQLGSLFRDLGDFDAAERQLLAAGAAFAQRGDRAGELRVVIERHIIDSERGHSEDALAKLMELEPELVELGDAGLLARYYNTLGVQAVRNNQVDDADRYLQMAASQSRLANQPRQEAGAYNNLGQVLVRNRRLQEAEDTWTKAVEVFRDSGDRMGEAITLSNLGSLASMQGQIARSFDLNQQALVLMRELQASQHIARIAFNLGLNREKEGELAEAERLFAEALAANRDGRGGNDFVVHVTAVLMRVQLAMAKAQAATESMTGAQEALAESSNPLIRSHLIAASGQLARDAGRLEEAGDHFREALALRQAEPSVGWVALSELDSLELELDQDAEPERVRAQAERIAERMAREDDARVQLRVKMLEAETLIRMRRGEEALRVLGQGDSLLAAHSDAALDLELKRLRILAGSEPPAARRERLLVLATEADQRGFRRFALRCRLDIDPGDAELREEIRLLGFEGLLAPRDD